MKKGNFLRRSFFILISEILKFTEDFRWMQLICGNNLEFSYSCLLPLLLLTVVKSDREHVEHGFSGKFKKEHGAEGDRHDVHADHKVVIGMCIYGFHCSS